MARKHGKTTTMTAAKEKALMADLLNAEHDVLTLLDRHRLTPKALADWIGNEDRRRCLVGLCQLANVQTQLLLSRYRLVAVATLIRQASEQESDASPEQIRKACVDLLKLNTHEDQALTAPIEAGEDDSIDEVAQQLTAMLLDPHSQTPTDQQPDA